MVSITVSSSKRAAVNYNDLISVKIRSTWMCVSPSGEVQVYIWMLRCGNIILLIIRSFDVAKFTTLTPLSTLISHKLVFSIVGLKISCLLTFAIRNLLKSYKRYFRNWLNTRYSSLKCCHFHHYFHPQLVHVQPEQSTTTWQCYIQYPLTKNFYPLNYWHDCLMYEKACP